MEETLFGFPVRYVDTQEPAPTAVFGELGTVKKTERTPPSGGSGVTQSTVFVHEEAGKPPVEYTDEAYRKKYPGCTHDFAFLRQEFNAEAVTEWGEVVKVATEDIFYCRHCLAYRKV